MNESSSETESSLKQNLKVAHIQLAKLMDEEVVLKGTIEAERSARMIMSRQVEREKERYQRDMTELSVLYAQLQIAFKRCSKERDEREIEINNLRSQSISPSVN